VSTPTNKKVQIARFDRPALEGFAQLPEGLTAEGVEILSVSGSVTRVPLAEVRAVCFVREFGSGETWQKQRAFLSRPKANGLWVRVRFRDGELLEGIMRNNLVADPAGFALVPPDPTFQNQHVWVPREAVTAVEVLGVIGSPLRRTKPPAQDGDQQLEMFG
jgi:hypothetical protein